MIITTTETIPGYDISEVLGVARGQIVRAKHIGSDIGAGLKGMVGGEIKGYTDMMEKARTEATNRLIDDAKKMGADAVVGMRYGSSTIMGGASEMLAYGTAVRLR